MAKPLPPLTYKDIGEQVPRRGHWLLRGLGKAILALLGWRVVGALPDVPRAVIIGAPHTSNFDGLVGVSAIQALSLHIRFMAKDSLFKGRQGTVIRWFGGVPINRQDPAGVVSQTAELIRETPFWLGITPEGTRSGAERWKTGFHRIARELDVPIIVAGLCYKRKQIRILDHFKPGEEVEQDLQHIYDLVRDVEPRHPERLSGPLRFLRLSDS